MARSVLAALAVLVGDVGGGIADPAQDPHPRKVLAFYYAWYGTPEVSGTWRHWERVDPEGRDIGSSTHYPVAGAYDSSDPAVIDRHFTQMAEGGIDGAIVSWWGPGAPDSDTVMPAILDAASRHGRLVSAYYETIPGDDPVARAVDDLADVVRRHGEHPAWLKVDGRPVVFLYIRVLEQLGAIERWAVVRRLVRERTGVDPYLVGDAVSHEAAAVFDGVHRYNTADLLRGLPSEEIGRRLHALAVLDAAIAHQQGKLACATVIPGYDDTKIRRPGLAIPRHDGATYEAGWEAARRSDADWALITSWNEWHEGSEIEPSVEHGDAALSVTPELVSRFRDRAARESGTDDPAWRAFAEQWAVGTIGLLGGTGVQTAGGELARSGLPFEVVSLRGLGAGDVSAREIPILIYVGGETVDTEPIAGRSLAEGLRRFAEEGGVVVVASPEAWPFYRDRASGRTAWSASVGLPLRGGFERPPETGYRFAFRGPLEPFGTAAYPAEGDRRFRPIVSPGAGVAFTTLVELLDPAGNPRGTAAAELVHVSGPHTPTRWIYVAAPLWGAVDRGALLRALLTRANALRPQVEDP